MNRMRMINGFRYLSLTSNRISDKQSIFRKKILSDKFIVNILSVTYLDYLDDQNILEYGINDAIIPKSDSVIVFTITQLSAADRAWVFSKA